MRTTPEKDLIKRRNGKRQDGRVVIWPKKAAQNREGWTDSITALCALLGRENNDDDDDDDDDDDNYRL